MTNTTAITRSQYNIEHIYVKGSIKSNIKELPKVCKFNYF